VNDYEKLFTKMRKQKHQLRILINKITDYKQEIEELKAEIKELNDSSVWWTNRFNAVERDNERLNNIIDELEKDLIDSIKYWENQELLWEKEGFIKVGGEANNKIIFKGILKTLRELKGSDKE
jgi:uncharacterized coiled-coil DUF342 family protein